MPSELCGRGSDVITFTVQEPAQAEHALVGEPSDASEFGHVPRAVILQAAVRDCAVRISYRIAWSTRPLYRSYRSASSSTLVPARTPSARTAVGTERTTGCPL